MIFDPNQTEFISEYQRVVWMYGTHIVPLEISLANIDDPEIIDGCTQVFNCTMEILEDMYNNPDDYCQERPRWYTNDYFAWLITGKKPIKHHNDNFKQYLRRIHQFGFTYDEENKMLSNDRYPRFVEYFEWLLQLAKDKKKNLGGYTDRRDFRLLNEKINLSFNDILYSLSDINGEYAVELHNYAVSKGFKIEKKDPYTFRYLYRKLYSLEIHNNPFKIVIPYRLDNGKYVPNQFERFLAVVEAEPDCDDLFRYIQGGAYVCNACGGKKKVNQRCGRWVDIHGARRLISVCRPAISRCRRGLHNTDYTNYDIKMLKRMIDIRIVQIDDYLEGN